jgi:hypothetical protein
VALEPGARTWRSDDLNVLFTIAVGDAIFILADAASPPPLVYCRFFTPINRNIPDGHTLA